MPNYILTLENLFSSAILITAILGVISVRISGVIRFYIISSLFLAALTVIEGIKFDISALFIQALIIVLIKSIILPFAIRHFVKHSKISYRVKTYLKPTSIYLIISLVIGLMLILEKNIPVFSIDPNSHILFIAITLVLLSFIQVIIHRGAVSEIISFLMIENGISLFAITTLGDLPLIFEMGLVTSAVIGGVLMIVLLYRIQQEYGSIDTDTLTELIE